MHLSLKRPRFPVRRRRHDNACLLVLAVIIFTGCASSGGGGPQGGFSGAGAAEKILACKSTDRQVASSDQCLQDDAACYQINSGQWCTGERGSVCPEGSSPVVAGTACPAGARCFRYSESLECMI